MGGGRRYLMDKNMRDVEEADTARTDGKNVIQALSLQNSSLNLYELFKLTIYKKKV